MKTEYRIVKRNNKFYPQYKGLYRWNAIKFVDPFYDNYSGRGTKTNAIQRLYIYMSKQFKIKRAISINSIGSIGDVEYFQCKIL